MNKKILFSLFIFLFVFIPNVNAEIEHIDLNSNLLQKIPLPANTKFIYFSYKREGNNPKFTGISNSYFNNVVQDANVNVLVFQNYKVTTDKKGKKTVSYLSGTKTYNNVASMTIPKIGYYIDENIPDLEKRKIWLNLKVDVKKIKIQFFDSEKACKKKYKYKISKFDTHSKKFGAMIGRYITLNEEASAPSVNNECNINVSITYKFTFVRVDKGTTPGNLTYLWLINDLDQPQDYYKKKSSFDGAFTESIDFGTSFYPKYYLYNGTYLRDDGTKFIATMQTCNDKNEPDGCIKGYQTTVYAFQKGPSATVTWKGSRDLGTTLIGTKNNYKPTEPPPKIPPCEFIDGKYYDNNGDIVDEATFVRVCKFKFKLNTCKEYNNGNVDGSGEGNVSNDVENVECGSGTRVEDKETDFSATYNNTFVDTPYTDHSSCKYEDAIVSELLYEKVGGTKKIGILDNEGLVHDLANEDKRCVPVDINVKTVLTEDIEFNIKEILEPRIYAGGGFSWGGANATSTIGWVPRVFRSGLKKDDKFEILFGVTHHYVYQNEEKRLTYTEETISSIDLYTDSNCDNKYTEDMLKNHINNFVTDYVNKLSGHDLDFTSSSDSNNVTGNVMMDLKKLPIPRSDNKVISSVSLKHAYIDRKSALIVYTDDNKELGENYIDAGIKYYVPLKYVEPVFSISMNQVDISALGQGINVKASCDIDVEQIYYDKDKGGKGKLAYRYRPIKVVDVFNGKNKVAIASKAQNWASWYCNNDECNDSSNSNLNRTRVANTYDNKPLYSISLDANKIDKISEYNSKHDSYSSFDSIELSGESKFISEMHDDFSIVSSNRSYCGLGVFSNSCDVQTGGDS